MYENGRGVPQNYKQAAIWYRKAADQGHADAQSNLGLMYANGHGVPQDYVEVDKWFSIAALSATDESVRHPAVKSREIAETKMTAAEIKEAQKRAAEWKAK